MFTGPIYFKSVFEEVVYLSFRADCRSLAEDFSGIINNLDQSKGCICTMLMDV